MAKGLPPWVFIYLAPLVPAAVPLVLAFTLPVPGGIRSLLITLAVATALGLPLRLLYQEMVVDEPAAPDALFGPLTYPALTLPLAVALLVLGAGVLDGDGWHWLHVPGGLLLVFAVATVPLRRS